MVNNKNWNLLDCTLRDGGYYNNWNFSKPLIQNYLYYLSKTNISYIELGFRFFKKEIPMGLTAYTNDILLNSLKIKKNIKVGVMINAGDLIKNKNKPLNELKKLFPKINKKINFVRFACHHEEIFHIKDCITWLLSKKIEVFVNIMQISEIEEKAIKKICFFLQPVKIKALYIADSLGSLNNKSFLKVANKFKKFWSGELGLHAHDNLRLALSNSLLATKSGFKWIDSTISGMGRGPGNLKTEEIIKYYNLKDIKFVRLLKKKYFDRLKKHYKWGTNKYYKFAARHKIHPTYIQEMLSDKRYGKKNYSSIANSLKESETTKYDPIKLFLPKNSFLGTPKGTWVPAKDLKEKNVLILGPGQSIKKNKFKIENFIEKNDIFVISVNTSRFISENYVNMRAVCHPRRIISDAEEHNNHRLNLVMPYSMIPSKLSKYFTKKNKIIYDFGLILHDNKKIIIAKNFCTLPNPLAILYSLSVAISGKSNKIYLAGFDGYKSNDPDVDETNYYLKIIQNKYKKFFIRTITKSKYHIPSIKI
jgi:4-hydroxy 2-oxovalerate aldolase